MRKNVAAALILAGLVTVFSVLHSPGGKVAARIYHWSDAGKATLIRKIRWNDEEAISFISLLLDSGMERQDPETAVPSPPAFTIELVQRNLQGDLIDPWEISVWMEGGCACYDLRVGGNGMSLGPYVTDITEDAFLAFATKNLYS